MRGRSKSRPKGRAFEREVASMFGGKRTPLSGAVGGNDITFDNVIWNDWGFEAKRRARLPALVTQALKQADMALGIGSIKRPCVVMREDTGDAIFIAWADDVRTWCEALAESGQGPKLRALAKELEVIAAELRKLS